MIEDLARQIAEFLVRWVAAACRFAWLVVVFALVVTVSAGVFTAQNFSINTDTRDMISAEVPFRQNDDNFDAAFPQFDAQLVIVIDAWTPEDAANAATRLATALETRPDLFRHVRNPIGERFFKEHAFLFLDEAQLAILADRLAAAEPLLANLKEDTSLRGLFAVLGLAIGGAANEPDADALNAIIRAIAGEIEGETAGAPGALSWQEILAPAEARPSRRAFVTTRPVLDLASLRPAERPVAEVRRLAASLGIDAATGYRLRLTGPIALDHEEFDIVEAGGITAGLISICLVTILLIVGLRSVWLVLATVTTLLAGLIWTAAFAMLAVGHLNIISVAFAVLFVGLGVDFGIHFALRAQEACAGDRDKSAGVLDAARGVAGALALSALCAAAGFFAFLPTNYKGLAELGLIAGTGMFFALVANLTLLPALLSLLPMARPVRKSGRPRGNPIDWLVRNHSGPILAVASLLAAAGLLAASFAKFDFNPLNLKDPDSPSVAMLLELARDPTSSPYTIDILAPNLAAGREIASALSNEPQVGQIQSLESFVPADQDDKLAVIDDMAFFLGPVLTESPSKPPPSPSERLAALEAFRVELESLRATGFADPDLEAAVEALAGALSGLFNAPGFGPKKLEATEQRLLRHLPQAIDDLGLALEAGPVSLASLPESLRRDWLTGAGAARLVVSPAGGIVDNEGLRRFSDAVLAVDPTASGVPVVIAEAGRAVVAAFYRASAIAFVLVLLLLSIVLRRIDDIVLVLIPLGLALAITTAVSVLQDLAFNFANVIVLPLLFGLGVASDIHLVIRRRKEAPGHNLLNSSTSRAVMFSALTTIASFGSLIVSGHPGMRSMGQLLTIAITSTLLCTLIVLPSLMNNRRRREPAD